MSQFSSSSALSTRSQLPSGTPMVTRGSSLRLQGRRRETARLRQRGRRADGRATPDAELGRPRIDEGDGAFDRQCRCRIGTVGDGDFERLAAILDRHLGPGL